MGSFDAILDKFGASRELRDTIADVEAVIDAVSKVSSGVAAGKFVYESVAWALRELGFLEKKVDKIGELTKKVDQLTELVRSKFAEVLDAVHVEALLQRKLTIAQQLSRSRTAFRLLQPHPPDSPEFKERVDDADSGTLEAIHTLGHPDFWKRPYYAPWVYSDPWSGRIEPPMESTGPGAFVFEYRLTMAPYLEALAWRIVVWGLIGQKYANHAPPLSELAQDLLVIHDRILNAIVTLRAPTEKEFAPHYAPVTWVNMTTEYQRRESVWSQHGRRYGAVETYSAVAAVESWPELTFLMPQAPSPIRTDEMPGEIQTSEQMQERQRIQAEYAEKHKNFLKAMALYETNVKAAHKRFVVPHALRTLGRRKLVYAVVGLPAVWRAVNHLRKLAGEPPTGLCDYSGWSLREADEVVSSVTGVPPTAPVSLRSFAAKAPGHTPAKTISFRRLVEAKFLGE